MRKLPLYFICLIFLSSTFGCSIYMAAKRPDQKDLSFLKLGTKRELVVAELGSPVNSATNSDGQLEETYKFTQFHSKQNKVVSYMALDYITLGLWEIIGTPMELTSDGGYPMTLKVTYDENQTIVNVNPLNEEADKENEPIQKPYEETQEMDCDPGMESCT